MSTQTNFNGSSFRDVSSAVVPLGVCEKQILRLLGNTTSFYTGLHKITSKVRPFDEGALQKLIELGFVEERSKQFCLTEEGEKYVYRLEGEKNTQ